MLLPMLIVALQLTLVSLLLAVRLMLPKLSRSNACCLDYR